MKKFNNHQHGNDKAKVVAPTPAYARQSETNDRGIGSPSIDRIKDGAPSKANNKSVPDNTMRQQKQQKQYQREPQQQPGSWVVNSDNPDFFSSDSEQKRQSRLYQIKKIDGLHNQGEQQQSYPSVDMTKAQWQKNIAVAKVVWGKLTHDEILESEGRAEKLSALISERYAITHSAANEQVKSVLDKLSN